MSRVVSEDRRQADVRVSVAVVVYRNPLTQILGLLQSLRDNRTPMDVRVIDNDSYQPDFARALGKFGAEYSYSGGNVGFGRAHNQLVRRALEGGYTYHAVINPDIVCRPGALDRLTSFMDENPTVGLASPRVLNPDGTVQRLCKLLPSPYDLFIRRFGRSAWRARNDARFELHRFGYDRVADVPSLTGAFMFLRVAVLQQTGGFDERYFMYLEDLDLCRRIGRVARTVFVPTAEVVHEHGAGSYKSRRLLLTHIHSTWIYFSTYGWWHDAERDEINRTTVLNLPDEGAK